MPVKGKDGTQRFLTHNAGKLCLKMAKLLGVEATESSLLTHVISTADQRYSHNVAELNFDLYCNPAVTAPVGTDELYDKLLWEFPELARIDVQITYLVGVYHSTRNNVRRECRS